MKATMVMVWLLGACSTHTVTGTVNNASQEAIAGASCDFFDQQVETNETGVFTFDNLDVSKGEYEIRCTAKGYSFYSGTFNVSGTMATAPTIILEPLDVQIPYLPMNLDPEGELLPNK